MSAIGAYSFIRMSGPQVPALAKSVEVIDRPGVDGAAFRENALKVPAIEKQTVATITLLADAQTAVDYYAALKGTLVTITEDCGRSVNSVMVLDVRVTQVQAVVTASDATTNYVVTASWVLQPTL